MQQSVTLANLTLNDVKQHFEHWRATREKRCKIPDFLWDEVKALIGRYPTNQITQTLCFGNISFIVSICDNTKAVTFGERGQVIAS